MMNIFDTLTSDNLLGTDSTIHWSPSTGGFYVVSVHIGQIPTDAVVISKETHMQLLEMNRQGYVITKGDDGRPVATKPKISMDRLLSSIRSRRNKLLLESDYIELPSMQASLTDEKKLEWSNYRQALRDITEQPDLLELIWPTKP